MNQSEQDDIKTVRSFERADFTKYLKRKLMAAYPGHKVSVKGSTGTAWSWIHVKSETLSADQIAKVVRKNDVQDADPMTDYYGSGWKLSIHAPSEATLKASRIWEQLFPGPVKLLPFLNLNYKMGEYELPDVPEARELADYMARSIRGLKITFKGAA